MKNRIAAREQDPKVRATNFEEVCLGYNNEEAVNEASRCLNCKNPKCRTACPVGVNIPSFIHSIREGNFSLAYKIITEDNSLPAVCGRVCPQEKQCEGSCILGVKGEPVAIGKLERFAADWQEANNKEVTQRPASNGIKVAVIGSGPGGLSCAFDLAKNGFEVTLFESLHKLGGVLTYGIPEFRLPKKKVVEKELFKLAALGVKVETNVFIGKTLTISDLFKEGFKAVYIGTGAGLPMFLGIEGEALNGVFSANEFLTRNNLMGAYMQEADTPIFRGKNVCVVGGGNVAMDAARTALRLGAKVTIVYRRGENELPARREEVHHAKQEGVSFEFLSNPVAILGDSDGNVSKIKCIRMALGEPDSSGRRRPIAVEGSEFMIASDVVIVALGTRVNSIIEQTTPGLKSDSRGHILTDDACRTSLEGVFAGGDVVTGAATVILAMGEGRRAAASIVNHLKASALRS